MEDKKSIIKLYTFTYGKGSYITILSLAAVFTILGAFLLPNREGIALLLGGLVLVGVSFYLVYSKYLNYVTLTDAGVSTKKQFYSWNEVCITMSYFFIDPTVSRKDYYIFFDDHYLSREEIYSQKVKKDAFYLMVTPERLNVILQRYNKRIELLERCCVDHKHLYDKVCEYNEAEIIKQGNN